VENPADTFGEAIAGVDDALDFLQEELTSLLPVLYCEVLDVYVARSFGGTIGFDHFDSGLIVLTNGSGAKLGVKPSWARMDRRYLVTLPEETAARNLASVLLVAVMDWVLDQYTTTPPARRKA
jgi:hypothetical protein